MEHKKQLTQSQLEVLVKARKLGVFAIGDGSGLCLRITPTGASWILRYRFDNIPRAITIGKYEFVSMKAAQKMATAARAKVYTGTDPLAEKRRLKDEKVAARAAKKAARTFRDLAEDYLKVAGPGLARNTLDDRTGMLRFDVLPRIGSLRLEEVTGTHVVHMLETIGKRSPTMARRAFGVVQVVFNHGIGKHWCKSNPCAGIKLQSILGKAVPVREPKALSEAELRALLPRIDDIGRPHGLALRVILATAVRKNELVRARWEHLDLASGLWVIPVENSKNKKSLTIPLARPVVAWFSELRDRACGSPWVLPGHRQSEPISDNTLNVALEKLRGLDGAPRFTIHDLRRSARSLLGALGVDYLVAEKALNHSIGGLHDVYDRGTYLPERRAALEKLSSFLVACEEGRPWIAEPLKEAA